MLLSDDRYLVRREVDVPELGLILDEDAFASRLMAQFPELELRQVKKRYIRYKRATNCIVSYEMTIAQRTVLAYAKALSSPCKLEKYRHRPGQIQDFGIGRIVLEPENIIFSVLPNDNDLKQLSKLFDPASRQELLKKLLANRPDLLSKATLHTLRYKPERRYVAQLKAGEEVQAIVKAYTSSDYEQARLNATTFYATQTHSAFEVATPLQILPELGHSSQDQLLAFPWIAGISLGDQIAQSRATRQAILQTGQALAQLHQRDPQHLKVLNRSDEAKTLLNLASDLSWLCPQQKQRIQAIAVQLSIALLKLPMLDVPIHGDFNAEQVLLNSDSTTLDCVTLIDFDRAIRSDPATDLGSFIAKLEQEKLRGRCSASDL